QYYFIFINKGSTLNDDFDLNNFELFYYSFLHSNDAMVIFTDEKFIACNKELANYLELNSIDDFKTLNPFEIIPVYQPDGTLSHIKFHKYLDICKKNGEVKFDWLYKTVNDKDLFVEVVLTKYQFKNEEFFLAKWLNKNKLRELEKELENKNLQLDKKRAYLEKIDSVFKEQNINKDELEDTLFLLNEYKNAIDESSIISKSSKNGKITFVNDKFCEISGYTKEELIGKNHNIVRHSSMSKDFFKNLWETILNKEVFRGVIVNRKKDGSPYYVDTTIVPITDKSGEIVEFIAVRHDISEIYEKEKIIQKQYMDNLTKLPNRQKLISDLKDSNDVELVLVDISKFKDINDFYGYETGDLVLKKFAKVLQSFDIYGLNYYKLANDIFAILILKNTIDSTSNILKYIVKELEQKEIIVENNTFNLSFHIAVVNSKDLKNPIQSAEFALSLAKSKKKKVLFLKEHLDEYKQIQKNKELVSKIKDAISKDNILVYGQKIIDNKSKAEKYELLMRLKTSEGEILSPYFFLEASKKANLYLDLTKILVKKACKFFQNKNIEFSINLTIEDIKDTNTIDFIFKTIKETNTASKITFEIVESEAIDDFNLIADFIKKAKSVDCKIAIDDFGTGYSNFEYIINLNVDFLKIDGSLIKTINEDKNIELVAKTINNFAKVLNIKTVAEFVHNKEVLDKVTSLGIDYSQGFYLHEPEFLI
uniref:EAL domain-containing protein n=1 Tax=Arcobacter vandammei TaxID=2782243 RepID=UPI001D1831D9